MNPTKKTPVQPWIPTRKAPAAEASPTIIRRIIRQKAPSPTPALRAGWLVAIITGILCGIWPAIVQIPFFGIIYAFLILLPYPAGVAIIALSIVAMTRGAAGRGILLLIGGPAVAIALMWILQMVIYSLLRR